jgi:hypothetical protein
MLQRITVLRCNKALGKTARAPRMGKVEMVNGFEDAQKFGKEQMDRTLASVNALTKGVQAIAVEIADYQKEAFEKGSAALEKLLGVRSLDKAFEVQSEIVRNAYENFVGRATKIGELYVDLARDTYKPFEGAVAKGR